MPRTKISKSSKRNREAASREEKIRQFDSNLEGFMTTLETRGQDYINDVDGLIDRLKQRNPLVMQLKASYFFSLDLPKFGDWRPQHSSSESSGNHTQVSLMMGSSKINNPNDEGYLTEESCNSAFSSKLSGISSQMNTQQQRGRTPGPLSSARARRPRRSRSACGDYVLGSALKPKPSASLKQPHASRSKMRTPMTGKAKAFSADRTSAIEAYRAVSPGSPQTALMRWPKPGEIVLSQCGSPVVSQFMPERFANVNIPVRNGVLSLRPKKLGELRPDLIEAIEPETLHQIKTLHENLNYIMKMAESALK